MTSHSAQKQLDREEQQVDQERSTEQKQEKVDQKLTIVPPPVSTSAPPSPSTSPPISPSQQPQQPQIQNRFSGYLTDNVWYEVFRQLYYDLGEHLHSCLLVNTQFFRNAVPFFWRDVKIIYFSQLYSFVRILSTDPKDQTLPYARYIRTMYITAKTPRTPNKTHSAELASLLYQLASIDVNWRLLSFILELDWKDCEEPTMWTNFFAKIGKHLEHVALHGSSPFLRDTLSFSAGEFCPNLKVLTLESRYFNGYGIVNVAEKCSLTELSIWCRQVTSSVVLSILKGRSAQTLQKLTIKNCDLDDKPLLNSITTPEGYDNDDMPSTSNNENIIQFSYFSSSSKDNSSNISILPILPKLKSFSYIQSYPFKTGNKFTSSGLLRLLNNYDVTIEGLKRAIERKPDLRLRVGAFDSMVS
ncbi:unnamed protein product [Rhizophagus irregularis]|uniref:Uncharacterized protein n=1 Tax=Rhizophagus irregularis TaxID=588596 RepID=A0A916EJA5_9GLOM|nr:unnamed protein product [Rhizophagus irregularis]CAB4423453.1 unnamed protein product [Rhizophagus irregularis]CAB4423697.1 unnamed protein product [Rhizophagus irregularis]CAB4477323.1 unnamed protein product [Rhizophagus irregularis]CAB5199993.1 unnamed protein product [Rhizophagus irregularis]